MLNPHPGVGGHLFPTRFLADRAGTPDPRRQASLQKWWSDVTDVCGPATGPRAVFDLVAMPLCARLGFRAGGLAAARDGLTARLLTPRGRAVGLHVIGWRGWAARPPALWRDAVATARAHQADWCLVLAPPHLSIVPARGHASRRTLDFTFPDALEPGASEILMALAHASSFEHDRLHAWLADAAHYQARLHADLRTGVVEALHALTRVLRRRTQQPPTAFDQSLTLVYRILFLLFAESRALVPIHHPIYREAYTLTSLCENTMHSRTLGLWDALAAITSLSRTGGQVDSLRVFPFNGHLFSKHAAPSLEAGRRPTRPTQRSRARDEALSKTLLALGTRAGAAGRLPLHYGDFGVEQLGAVYERVLDLDPDAVTTAETSAQPAFAPRSHSATRKDTGTFYTPLPIAELTTRRTLGPLVDGASSDRILALRIVDPAMGSGAFLVAALRYLTDAYERAVIAEGRFTPLEIDDGRRADFRRLVAQRCLYGVDNNPVAVQVARLSLWLATLAHGKPLGFLDHRLRVGNSLLGTTPDAITRPLAAREHALPLFDGVLEDLHGSLRLLSTPLTAMAGRPDESVEVVRQKERQWAQLVGEDGPATRWKTAMHLWCARWSWPGLSRPPSTRELTAAIASIVQGKDHVGGGHVARWARGAETTARDRGYFHWPMEFADVFYDDTGHPRPDAGFDAVIGNPPWEMLRRDAQSNRRGTGRDPLVAFIRDSGLFPHCRTGHINLYQPFVDRALHLVNPRGRVGLVLPWGFAVDDGAAALRRMLVERGALDTIIGFDNARGLFPIHRGLRFVVATMRSPQLPRARVGTCSGLRARFGVLTTEETDAIPEPDEPEEDTAVPLRLDRDTVVTLGGPTCRFLDLRRPADLEWLIHVRRFPALGAPDGWNVSFSRELNASDDRPLFKPRRKGDNGLLVVEGKHIAPFRFDRQGPVYVVDGSRAATRLPDRRYARDRLAYRDVSGVGNTHALVAAILPAGVITTHTLFCLRTEVPLVQQHFLCGLFNSRLLDGLVRLEMGGHVTTSLVENLPVPRWTASPLELEIAALAVELRDAWSPESFDRLNASVRSMYGF